MAQIINEALVMRNAVDFLYENFKTGLARDLEPVEDQIQANIEEDENNIDLILHCMNTRDLEFYKWMSRHVTFPSRFYQLIYWYEPSKYSDHIEYIKYTEDVVPTLDNHETTRYELETACRTDELNPETDVEDIGIYTDWLISIGRASSLGSNVISQLVILLFQREDQENKNALERLLYIINIMKVSEAKKCIEEILHYCAGEDTRDLIILMSRVGLFSTAVGQEVLLNPDKPIVHLHSRINLPQDLINVAWTESLNVVNRPLHLCLCLLQRECQNIQEVDQTLKICNGHSEVISPFGLCILNSILRSQCSSVQPVTKPSQQLVGRIVLEGIIVPKLWESGVDSSIITESVRMIFTYGQINWIKKFHDLMYESPNREIYIAALNSLIIDQRSKNPVLPWRVVEILRFSGNDASIEIFLQENVKHIHPLIVDHLLKEVELRELSGWSKLAEDLLLKINLEQHKDGTVFLNNNRLIGRKVLHVLMFNITQFNEQNPTYPHLRRRVLTYAKNHLFDYIRGIVLRFIEGKDIRTLLKLGVVDAVIKTRGHLILGSRKYECRDDVLVNINGRDLVTLCSACSGHLTPVIYTRSADSHGMYRCSQCQDDTSNAVPCLICMSDDYPMQVISCGHCLCTQCVSEIAQNYRQICPLCKKKFELAITPYSLNEAVRMFMTEWNADPEEVSALAWEQYSESDVSDD